MPIVDKSLERKVARQQSRLNRVSEKSSDGTARSISGISSTVGAAKNSQESMLLSVLNKIDASANSGDFSIITSIPDRYLNYIVKELTRRSYIVVRSASEGATVRLLICWFGGKSWYKATFNTNGKDAQRITAAMIELGSKVKELGKYYQVLNPRVTSGTLASNERAFVKFFNKYK